MLFGSVFLEEKDVAEDSEEEEVITLVNPEVQESRKVSNTP